MCISARIMTFKYKIKIRTVSVTGPLSYQISMKNMSGKLNFKEAYDALSCRKSGS